MNKYRVGIWEEVGGHVIVKAKSIKEAKKIVEEKLSDEGVEAFKDFDVAHRAIDITDSEQI